MKTEGVDSSVAFDHSLLHFEMASNRGKIQFVWPKQWVDPFAKLTNAMSTSSIRKKRKKKKWFLQNFLKLVYEFFGPQKLLFGLILDKIAYWKY